MTLRTARKTINDTKILVTADHEYIKLDYLGDEKVFSEALAKINKLLSRKVKYISYNKAAGCIQIDCE